MSRLLGAAIVCVLIVSMAGCASSRTVQPATSRPVPLPPAVQAATKNSGGLAAGTEAMYALVDTGTMRAANDLLKDVWDIPRYRPVTLHFPLTWHEDPYREPYWRFQFYSLRPTANLLWAYYTTGKRQYLDKLLDILRCFTGYDATDPPPDPSRLDYAHGAAFRAMVLVDDYVRLHRSGVLPGRLGEAMLASIGRLGSFLTDPNHYESKYNHGFTEASALLLVAVNFPSMPEAGMWRRLALRRLTTLMERTVDPDGVEIERSPFYHFYVFDFALQLEGWARRSGVTLPKAFTDRVASMIRYSTDIIWPNGRIPLIGSSVRFKPSGYHSLYAQLEATDPQFAYAVSGGTRGRPPTERATLFPTSGQVILRSPIDLLRPYADNSQLAFNAGPPSTKHSHLDSLAVTYYTNDRVVLPDSGLDTYAPGSTFDFFHGTSAHNTVTVDGHDQAGDTVRPGLVRQGEGWEYASAGAELYRGVHQARSVLLLGHDLLLVVDTLNSRQPHRYEQLWHLMPGAHLTMNGASARVTDGTDRPIMQIVQGAVSPDLTERTYFGERSPMQGWYSAVYGKVQRNHVIGYGRRGRSATYLTLIATGPSAVGPVDVSGSRSASGAIHTRVCGANLSADISIRHQATTDEDVTVRQTKNGCAHGH